MRFSVLLPTRNRLEYLRYAVETVCKQDYADWEIIVSDNFSEDDIAGYVASIGDTRIRYVRTEKFVPVTDNWNNALNHCGGDYVVMLGDDDGLMPGYFTTIVSEMVRFPEPDFVYVSAYFYAYPGVMPGAPQGFLRRDRNGIFTESAPFWLDNKRAAGIARAYLDFRMPVASNMQFSLISRRMIVELTREGQFFQSPYPDFYATPALFLSAKKILVVPRPLVIIGITPKSYGYFHFNNRPEEGMGFLRNEAVFMSGRAHAGMLPGTSYNDSWLLANSALSANVSAKKGMLPKYGNYRFLQIVHCYKKCYFDGAISRRDLSILRSKMSFYEKYGLGLGFQVGFSMLRMVPLKLREFLITRLRASIGQHGITDESPTNMQFQNLCEVFRFFDSDLARA